MSLQEKISLIKNSSFQEQRSLIFELPKKYQKEIINRLSNQEIVNLFHCLDPDEITDLVQLLEKHRRKKILESLQLELKNKVEFLLKFDPESAAGLMNLDYIKAEKTTDLENLIKRIKDHEKRTGKIPTVLILENNLIKGELPVYSLIFYPDKEKVFKHLRKVSVLKYNQNEKEVIEIFKKHPHRKIVVLDDDNSVLGIIYSDDILRVINKYSVNDLYSFAGLKKEESIFDSTLEKVKNRYKWLILNLGTAFLAASVVNFFQETISALVLLAVYMPIIAGMGGNAGVQTLAVIVRGLVLKQLDIKSAKKLVFNELAASFLNGLINGVLVALIAYLWHKSMFLGLIVGISMVLNLLVAGFFGAIVPLVIKKFNKDPAVSAGILITTFTDIFGFLIFLGLARLFL